MDCSYIRLDKPQYAEFHLKNKVLGDKEKEQFLEVMNSEYPNIVMYDVNNNLHKCAGYQAACLIWANTYENGSLSKFNLNDDGLIRQLDYSTL